MNKQELIERIEGLKNLFGNKSEYVEIDTVIRLISELDEPQEVEIPIFVADFITEQKKLGHTLSYSIDACMSDRVAEWYWDNSELFALAWIFGYKIDEEKRYRVKLKSNNEEVDYLVATKRSGLRFYSNIYTRSREHTKKQLEDAGFGWVFDCPGVEIEEV